MVDTFDKSTVLKIDSWQLDHAKFTKTHKDEIAVRVVIGASEHAPITNLLLTSNEVDSGVNVGTLVGHLVPEGGTGPFLYVITDDPDDKFAISGNELVTGNPINYYEQNAHTVTVKVLDVNDQTYTKAFIITVNEGPQQVFTNDYATQLNGSDEYCYADYDTSFSGLSTFSLSCWVKLESASAESVIVANYKPNSKKAFNFYLDTNKFLNISISQDGSNEELFTGNTPVTLDSWVHVAFAFDGINKTIKTWVASDIDVDNTTTATQLFDTGDIELKVGARDGLLTSATAFYNGVLDELSIYDYALTDLRVRELYNYGSPNNVKNMTSSSHLISNYRMGDGDTAPTLLDETGSNNLTMVNMDTTNIVLFDYTNLYSMNFNGVDEKVTTTADYSGKEKLTISYWVYVTGSDRIDVGQTNDDNVNRIKLLRNNTDKIYVVIDSFAGHVDEPDTNMWKHIVMVYDGTALLSGNRVKFYMQGSEETLTTSGTPPTQISSITNKFNIGFDDGSGSYSTGNIDEVTVWGEALSDTEVTELYNNGSPSSALSHSQSGNLLNYWRMGENFDGTTLTDQKGTDDGTAVNMDASNKDTNTP